MRSIWDSIGIVGATAIFGAFGVVFLMFLWATLGSFMGFVAGWILEKTFLGEAIAKGMFELFGKQVSANALPQVGALLGFVSGFFKHTIRVKTGERN